jgi:hypothetical protein
VTLTAETVPALTGNCVLSGCRDRVTGQVTGSEPLVLVCDAHTDSVERAADYIVRRIGQRPAPDRSREH